MRDEHNPESYPDKLQIQSVEDLPAFMRDPIKADAKSIKESLDKPNGPEWLAESLALLKYQVEGAHERLDDVKDVLEQLARANNKLHEHIHDAGAPQDDEGDWWKGERN